MSTKLTSPQSGGQFQGILAQIATLGPDMVFAALATICDGALRTTPI